MQDIKGKFATMSDIWFYHNTKVVNPVTGDVEKIVGSVLRQEDNKTFAVYQLESGELFYSDDLGIEF